MEAFLPSPSQGRTLNSAEVEFMRIAAGGGMRGEKAFNRSPCVIIKVFVSASLPASVSSVSL